MCPVRCGKIFGIDLVVAGLNVYDHKLVQVTRLNLITQVLLIDGSPPR